MPKKILFVDDDESARTIYCDRLRQDGFLVEEASSGSEGLEKIKIDNFDAVVADLRMPGMDGLQLAREIRNYEKSKLESYPELFTGLKEFKSSRIIVITASRQSEEEKWARESGANDYVGKDTMPPKLFSAHMAKILNEKNP